MTHPERRPEHRDGLWLGPCINGKTRVYLPLGDTCAARAAEAADSQRKEILHAFSLVPFNALPGFAG